MKIIKLDITFPIGNKRYGVTIPLYCPINNDVPDDFYCCLGTNLPHSIRDAILFIEDHTGDYAKLSPRNEDDIYIILDRLKEAGFDCKSMSIYDE